MAYVLPLLPYLSANLAGMHKTNNQQKYISVIKVYFVVILMHSGMFMVNAKKAEVPQLGEMISSVSCWHLAFLALIPT